VLWLLAWVFSADIGAYFAGRAFGRLKLAPRISPAKTWEGVIGGVLLAMVTGSAGAWIFDVPMEPAICFAIALAGLSIVGDLTESFFKRIAGLKDSGGLLPGHGGVLDRIDSVTAAAPLFALALSIYEGMHGS
jgi:phosphatidate cytidylyltransferase